MSSPKTFQSSNFRKEDLSGLESGRKPPSKQSEINIGLVGHVDHGKTTLTSSLSGVWTDRHSEEIKRGISIRLGYADCSFYKCPKCDEPSCYCTSDICPKCGSKTEFLRKVSFVDAPGHETLMAVMLSGAAIMDGAVLVIAANEPCPQPQTAEHLMALEILGIKNIVIAQNKVDLISKEDAIKNYHEIKEFIKGTIAENSLIIPIAAHYNANIDVLIQAIEKSIPTPKRDITKDPIMYVARSFDINKPGTKIDDIEGGVVGGSLIRGKFKLGDMVEFRPGVKKKKVYNPIRSKIVSLNASGVSVDEVHPGGLVALGTELDPNLTKSDNLSGNVVGYPGKLPEVRDKLRLKIKLFKKLLGSKEDVTIKPLKRSEPLMLSIGSAITVGIVTNPKKGEMTLKLPVCAEEGSNVAISRRIGARWRLIGYGVIKG
ncbi:MAG: translation initiation factor IF-2 subunit gamma [Candidatus Altiarchaeales archaeon]|nr:MAG: translation initiation factor IF-2 subunit gamma [Candidatus Altiarchaeales archaeon]